MTSTASLSEEFPETIPALLAWRAARAPAGEAWLSFEGETFTLADVQGEVDRCAVGLAERGVVAGDRVAILVGNRPETIVAWLASNVLGAVAAPLNPAYKAPELAGVLALIDPRVLVVSSEHRALAEAAGAKTLAAPGDLVRAGKNASPAIVSPDDVAVLLATSGTTGAPKAVMQTHRTYALTAEAFPFWLGLDDRDRILCTLPLFHVNAQAYAVMAALACGAPLALLPKFSASRFWHEAKRHRSTQVNVVGAMVNILLSTAPREADRDHSLRTVYTALALPEATHRSFEDRFGVTMTVGYGLSESTFGTIWPRDRPPRFGTMGMLRQHPRLGTINHARVVAPSDVGRGDDEGRGAREGELWLRNPATMRGYFRDDEATRRTLEGGWLRTGDLVKRDDDGFFTFVARKKDVIRRRGENVAAAEIEGVLAQHPSVAEAAVIGVPSPLGEDEIEGFVVPRAGHAIDAEELRAFVRARLADFKVPTTVTVRRELPKTATERVAKHLLK